MLTAVNPATGETVREVAADTDDQVEKKLAASLKAYRDWKEKSFSERGKLLRDVAKLMRELRRLLKPEGGRALLFGSAHGGGSAEAVLKVARKQQATSWRVVERTPCSAAGVACEAVLLERV